MTKGVHIVVPRERLPINNSIYFDVPDGRMIFAIPRDRITYIGTTDTDYHGDINDVRTDKEDVDYLLNGANSTFPTINLTIKDVRSSWAGLRPLIEEEGKSASELSRKDEIFESDTGLISIAGGKLTGYRKMAERIIDLIGKKAKEDYEIELGECRTDKIVLSGGPYKNAAEVEKYAASLSKQLSDIGIEPYYGHYLTHNYGKQSDQIITKLSDFKDKDPLVRLARAELWFTVNNEMVQTTLDFFNRRTGRLYFNLETIAGVKEAVIKDLSMYFEWDKERRQQEKVELEKAIYLVSHFE